MSSSSNFEASNLLEDNEWEEKIVEQNQQLDQLIEDIAIWPTTLPSQPTTQTVRAKMRYIERKRIEVHDTIFEQYFAEDPIYPPDLFRTRYRMRKPLFEKIMNKLVDTDNFFVPKRDATGHGRRYAPATGRLSMSTIQKCIAAMRMLAYEAAADLHDEYLRMSAQLIRKSLIKFVECVISNFGDEYLRKSNKELARLLHIGKQRGFLGMLGSIDCMHWEWKNCPTSWAGQYAKRSGSPTIILEAIASQDLWIWPAFIGTPGLRNDTNVFDQSPVFDDILEGRAPKV
ncbi:uncharacterized protein LOC121803921 [Salvia splendens]|uniref:uncharacterized protein LOC121803921 n=1 Tax=Salvia splendens TaxID=180675 RepID=UPI001C272C57|nr:uncharacterized protein LOC121803921 [Salvia splendens]